MPKKRRAKSSSDTPEHAGTEARSADNAEQTAENSPEIQAAEEAVRRAKAELKKAQGFYHEIRRQATDQIKQVRQKTVGDLIDGTLDLVKKHPGPGVVIAAVMGFFLGRLFRR